jgi:hypothetical protein
MPISTQLHGRAAPTRETRARRARRRSGSPISLPAALATAALLLLASLAQAAKWGSCPDVPPLYPSVLGATNAPFVHPGHELRIVLSAPQVADSGGFGVGPDENLVEIEITNRFGDAVVFAPRRANAASPSVLTFTFPDSQSEMGRTLAGPTTIRVSRADRLVAQIDANDLVALPPANDVTSIVLGETPHQVLHAALGADGDLWVPARFRGDPKAMPGCPGQFLMPLPVEIGGASIPGLVSRGAEPLARIRRASLYLADFDVNGTNFYGLLQRARIPLVHVSGSLGVAICQMNDAVDVVLRVKGRKAWSRSPRSVLRDVIAAAAPVPLVIRASTPRPQGGVIARTGKDSFGNACSPVPLHAGRGDARP